MGAVCPRPHCSTMVTRLTSAERSEKLQALKAAGRPSGSEATETQDQNSSVSAPQSDNRAQSAAADNVVINLDPHAQNAAADAEKPWFRGEPRSNNPNNVKEEEDEHGECEEPHHAAAERVVIGFWIVLCLTALVLGFVYFVVKVNKSDCADGTALPGDVTAPDDPSFGEVICVIYGFVPYVCLLGCVVELFRRRSVWPILLMMMGACIVVVNEGVIKRIVSQDRPSGSCLHSKGMPSSHSALATAYFVNIHLEIIATFISSKKQLSSTSEWTITQKAVISGLLWTVLFPVPFTRVALHDHSWAQIGVGALVGLCVGTGWFLLLTFFGYQRLDKVSKLIGRCKCCWGEGLFHHFVNDYSPIPPPECQEDCQRKERECRKNDALEGEAARAEDRGSVSPPQMGQTAKSTRSESSTDGLE